MPETLSNLAARVERQHPGLKEAYEDGVSVAQLAARYGRARQTITTYAKKLGWESSEHKSGHHRKRAVVNSLIEGNVERITRQSRVPYTPEEIEVSLEIVKRLEVLAQNAALLAGLVNKHLASKAAELITPQDLRHLAAVNKTCVETVMCVAEGMREKSGTGSDLVGTVIEQIQKETEGLPGGVH